MVSNKSLIIHSLSVALEMNEYAIKLNEDSSSPFVGVISRSGTMKNEHKFQLAAVAKNMIRTFSDDVFLIGKGNEPFQFAHINDIVNASTKSCFLQKNGLYGKIKYTML